MFLALPPSFGDGPTNMAIDVALLHTLPAGAVAFRHYGWTEPTLTFGYSQPFKDVRRKSPAGVALCRRPSGGGTVDHRNDWTYALVAQGEHAIAAQPADQLYQTLHEAVAAALASLEIDSRLAPCPRSCDQSPVPPTGPEACFQKPVMHDVLDPAGLKIAGAALKRTRQGLLVQGSIALGRLPGSFNGARFSEALCQALIEAFRLEAVQPDDLRPLFDGARIDREKSKFASVEWTTKR